MTDDSEPMFDIEQGIKVFTGRTMKEREEALQYLLLEAWRKGWDACEETYREQLLLLGIHLTMPAARA